MSTFTVVLLQKTEVIEFSPDGFKQKLTFEACFPKRERLSSHTGEEVARGFVELVTSHPGFTEPTLMFAKSSRDSDTGETMPPSISFYALVPEKVFDALRKAPPTAKCSLNLTTELMGAVRFNDSLGFEKVWNTEEQNPVKIQYFEFSVQHQPSDA